jgi:hypothetical protein
MSSATAISSNRKIRDLALRGEAAAKANGHAVRSVCHQGPAAEQARFQSDQPDLELKRDLDRLRARPPLDFGLTEETDGRDRRSDRPARREGLSKHLNSSTGRAHRHCARAMSRGGELIGVKVVPGRRAHNSAQDARFYVSGAGSRGSRTVAVKAPL